MTCRSRSREIRPESSRPSRLISKESHRSADAHPCGAEKNATSVTYGKLNASRGWIAEEIDPSSTLRPVIASSII